MADQSDAEVALEKARKAWHRSRGNADRRREFKEAQRAVVAERQAARQQREAEGAPADALDVKVDPVTGKTHGWNTPAGDAVVSPGGVS